MPATYPPAQQLLQSTMFECQNRFFFSFLYSTTKLWFFFSSSWVYRLILVRLLILFLKTFWHRIRLSKFYKLENSERVTGFWGGFLFAIKIHFPAISSIFGDAGQFVFFDLILQLTIHLVHFICERERKKLWTFIDIY